MSSSESEEEEVYHGYFANPPVNPPANPPPSPVSSLDLFTRQRPVNNNNNLNVSMESDGSGIDVPICIFDLESDLQMCRQFMLLQCFGNQPSSLQHIIKDKVEHILIKEIQASNVQGVRKILALLAYDISDCARPDLNKIMCNGYTPLTMAAKKGNSTILEDLIESGADPDLENEFDKSALVLAVADDHVAAVKVLLDAGAHFNLESKPVRSLLVKALANGQDEIVHAVLSKKGGFKNNDKDLKTGRFEHLDHPSSHKPFKTRRNLAHRSNHKSLKTGKFENLACCHKNESPHTDEVKSRPSRTFREKCVIQ